MAKELSRIERVTLQKLQERGGALRIDISNPNRRGLYWLLEKLAERGYVKVVGCSGTVVGYKLHPHAELLADREAASCALPVRP